MIVDSSPQLQGQKARTSNALLWLVAVGIFMETLDTTIVNTAIPSMAEGLGESPLQMQSVIIAYSLTIAVLIPASGWIADRFGTKRVFFSAILFFTLGSLFCALAQNLPQLIIARILQGTGGAMLMPTARLAVLRAFPGPLFLPAISFATVPALIGPLLGPTLGGWLVEYSSWHWIFLINIPIGVLGCLATYLAMPDTRVSERKKFDFGGFALLALSMVSISYGLDGLADVGISHAAAMLLIISGLASLTAYVFRAGRQPEPLFSMALFKAGTYSIGLLGNLFARIGASSIPFLIPLFLQVSLRYTPFESGMAMIPIAIAGILSKRFGQFFIMRFGYRRTLITNTICLGLSIACFVFINPLQPLWIRIAQLTIFGTVNSLQFTAMNTVTLKDLHPERASAGNSLYSMMQMLAMSFGVATAGAILTAFMDRFGGRTDPAMGIRAFHATFVCSGFLTCTSAWIFWQLHDTDESEASRI